MIIFSTNRALRPLLVLLLHELLPRLVAVFWICSSPDLLSIRVLDNDLDRLGNAETDDEAFSEDNLFSPWETSSEGVDIMGRVGSLGMLGLLFLSPFSFRLGARTVTASAEESPPAVSELPVSWNSSKGILTSDRPSIKSMELLLAIDRSEFRLLKARRSGDDLATPSSRVASLFAPTLLRSIESDGAETCELSSSDGVDLRA
jgi:hypothetical protein